MVCDEIFKLIIESHGEHCKTLEPERQSDEEKYFVDVNQRKLIIKYELQNYWKDAKYEYNKKPKSNERNMKG